MKTTLKWLSLHHSTQGPEKCPLGALFDFPHQKMCVHFIPLIYIGKRSNIFSPIRVFSNYQLQGELRAMGESPHQARL